MVLYFAKAQGLSVSQARSNVMHSSGEKDRPILIYTFGPSSILDDGEAKARRGSWGERGGSGSGGRVHRKSGVGQAAGREQVRIIGRHLAQWQRQKCQRQAAKTACEDQTLFSRATPFPQMLHPGRRHRTPRRSTRLLQQPVSCYLRRIGPRLPRRQLRSLMGQLVLVVVLLHSSTLLLFHISFSPLLLFSSGSYEMTVQLWVTCLGTPEPTESTPNPWTPVLHGPVSAEPTDASGVCTDVCWAHAQTPACSRRLSSLGVQGLAATAQICSDRDSCTAPFRALGHFVSVDPWRGPDVSRLAHRLAKRAKKGSLLVCRLR